MRKLLPWLFAVPSITATFVLLLKTNGQVVLTDQQLLLTIAFTAFKPFADLTLGAFGEQRESKKRERRDLIEMLLKAGLRQLINNHGLGWDTVGMNAFVVKEPWHRFGPAHLVRVGQVKFSLTHPSGVKWTKGKE